MGQYLSKAMWQQLFQRFLAPRASDEDSRRRELILNILLAGTILLMSVLFAITLIKNLLEGSNYAGSPPLLLFGVVILFIIFLLLSRAGLHKQIEYTFIGIFFLLFIWSNIRWGVSLPQGILGYSLVIVMTGVLINSRTAFYAAGFIALVVLAIIYLSKVGMIQPDLAWMRQPGNYEDGLGYGITFFVIALVAWLSNREIERSLIRARQSEKDLLEERNSLERKVRERTKALEKAQVEKMLDLQRFAEFGRLSATLLHELANPLTSVSLNLEQLEGKNRSKLIKHAREGISHMEQYVEAARRQLRNQSEIRLFDVATEIERVAGFLEAKAQSRHVDIKLDLASGVNLKGDSIRFTHIVSNLLTNAIDAYDGMPDNEEKQIYVAMHHKDQEVEVTVQDYGRGISKEQLPHLFEPFYTTKESLRGTGIGLAITKQAVEEAFKGTIKATYDKKTGTQFIVRIPLI